MDIVPTVKVGHTSGHIVQHLQAPAEMQYGSCSNEPQEKRIRMTVECGGGRCHAASGFKWQLKVMSAGAVSDWITI